MKIFIDADGCPVIDITVSIAKRKNIPVVIVKNRAHKIKNDYAEVVTVDISPDSADFYIFNHINSRDILITQDAGLSAMAISKGVVCLNQNGEIISNKNIDFILNNRHISRKLRKEKRIYSKAKKRESSMDSLFKDQLIKIINDLKD